MAKGKKSKKTIIKKDWTATFSLVESSQTLFIIIHPFYLPTPHKEYVIKDFSYRKVDECHS